MSTGAKCSWGLYHLVAVTTAFKAVEYFVMDKSGQTLYGANFMKNVFNEEDPIIKVLESGYYYKGVQKGLSISLLEPRRASGTLKRKRKSLAL